MLFRSDYSKPGPGVNKRDPNQSRLSIFFELLSRKLWDLCKINLVYIILAIPTLIITMFFVGIVTSRITDAAMPIIAQMMKLPRVDTSNVEFVTEVVRMDIIMRAIFAFLFMVFLGQGPVTAGFTYILRNYAREDHAWLFSDWWQHAKSNFKQAIIVFVVDVLVFCVFSVSISVYLSLGGALSFLAYIVVIIFIVYLTMHFYIYQLMITFENSLKDIYRNSLILTMQNFPRNLLMVLILLAVHIALPVLGIAFNWQAGAWILFFAAELLVLAAVSGFMINFFIYPQLEEYIKAEKGCESGNEV